MRVGLPGDEVKPGAGDQLDVTTEIPDLTLSRGDCDKGGFNDCATSIRVVRP
jgi:hypothetical protein